MVAGKIEGWGRQGLLDGLIVPRPITRIGLVGVGVAMSQLGWFILNVPLLAYVSGIAASFCLLSASAVWGMRDKADSVLDGEHLTAEGFRKERRAASALRRRSTWRATVVAVSALAAASPAVSHQLAGPIWHWMVLVCGAGVGEAAYSFLVMNAWEEQLRAHRDRRIEKAKEAEETKALIERIEAGERTPSPPELAGWTQLGGSLGISGKHHH